jgi:hypothetical protein
MNLVGSFVFSMKNSEEYLKYYHLEKYLFDEVSENFSNNHCLTGEEFFAIVFWKRKPSAPGVGEGISEKIKKEGGNILDITKKIYDKVTDEEKLEYLDDIGGIGVSIASAILTVCYPLKFTIIDYHAFNSLITLLDKNEFSDIKEKLPTKLADYMKKYLKRKTENNEEHINDITRDTYFEYLEICAKLAKRLGNFSLRDFDRILLGMDFYEGKNGLEKYAVDFPAATL